MNTFEFEYVPGPDAQNPDVAVVLWNLEKVVRDMSETVIRSKVVHSFTACLPAQVTLTRQQPGANETEERERLDQCLKNGSNWLVKRVDSVIVHANK